MECHSANCVEKKTLQSLTIKNYFGQQDLVECLAFRDPRSRIEIEEPLQAQASSEDLQLRKENLEASLSVNISYFHRAISNRKGHCSSFSGSVDSACGTPQHMSLCQMGSCESSAVKDLHGVFLRVLDPERQCRHLTMNFRSRRLHDSCWRFSCAFGWCFSAGFQQLVESNRFTKRSFLW